MIKKKVNDSEVGSNVLNLEQGFLEEFNVKLEHHFSFSF